MSTVSPSDTRKHKPTDTILRFYNHLYANQNAQAQEPDLISVHPVHQTLTTQHTRREHTRQKQQQYQHRFEHGSKGEHGEHSILRAPSSIQQALAELSDVESQRKPDFVHLVTLTSEMVVLLREQIATEKTKIPRGKLFTYNVTTAATLAHIDFVKSEDSVNLPAEITDLPGVPFFKLFVFNDGPGAISFSINSYQSDQSAAVGLKSGENIKFEFEYPIIKTFNIVAPTTSTIRIIGVI